ncbi:hypothetical protein NESM_000262800 [Novymonas esmeraldas]|uniref:Uncharacterized protein n=1 Tax=Novymonas esmeraldas TaxID=1808958 RepID=A0AAW0F8P2_9TRYP
MTQVQEHSPLNSAHRRAQREWVSKIRDTSNMIYRSAVQAQKNFDQYLTAMEHVGAMYKEYGELLSASQHSFLNVHANVEGLQDIRGACTRTHVSIHKWEHSEELYAVREQLQMQTQMLRARNENATKVVQACVERDELIKMHSEKSALHAKAVRKQREDEKALRKECEKLEQKVTKANVVAQDQIEAMAIKSTPVILLLCAQLFKAMSQNGRFMADRFSLTRAGAAAHIRDPNNDDAVTGIARSQRSPRSEISSIAPSGVYGQNYSTFHPNEADPRVSSGTQNSGIPLRYDTNGQPPTAA